VLTTVCQQNDINRTLLNMPVRSKYYRIREMELFHDKDRFYLNFGFLMQALSLTGILTGNQVSN